MFLIYVNLFDKLEHFRAFSNRIVRMDAKENKKVPKMMIETINGYLKFQISIFFVEIKFG